MQQSSILTFSIVLGLIFVVLDVYVLWRFQRFTTRHSFSHWWSRAAWLLGAIALGLYVFVAWRRHLFRMDGLDLDVFRLVCLWYLPKLPVAIVIATVQGFAAVRSGIQRLRRRPKPPLPMMSQQPKLPGRRVLLERTAWSVAAVPYVMVANGMVNTLYDFTVHNENVVLPGLPRTMDGFTLVQISDIHAGSFPDDKPFSEVVRLVNAARPDAIVITGDFVNMSPGELPSVSKGLEYLARRYPVYASLGNHDHYNSPSDHQLLIKSIRDFGIDLMINEHRRIGKGGDGFVIAAIDNVGFKQNYGRLDKALADVHADEPTILLAHDPTFWDASIVKKAPIDLMLSGHTHGGQIAFGLLGFELSPASFVYEQVAGMYRKGDQLLYVNRGLGTVGPPLRIGVPPEITVLTLRSTPFAENMA